MKLRYVAYIFLAILAACIAFGHQALAQTRLGLHVTQEELNIWRQRRTDSVNGVNGFSFQSIYQNRILADANAFRSQSHPRGDGFWAGYTGTGCVPNDQSINPGSGRTPFGRGNGAYLMRSAFNFLLTGDTSYADPVKTELLSQIALPGTDWTNKSKWCYANLGGGNFLEIVPWVYRLMLAFDYLKAGGYTGWTVTEKNNIQTWLYNSAKLFRDAQANLVASGSIDYGGILNTPPTYSCSGSHCTTTFGITHFNGWTMREATYYGFFNQTALVPALAMAMGLMASDSSLVDFAVKYTTAFLKLGVFDDGVVPDYIRWIDCSPRCPGSMWSHAMGLINGHIAVADMYARSGNKSLYNYTGATQAIGGKGGTVGLQTVIELMAKLANGTVVYYADDGKTALTWQDPIYGDYYLDFGSMAANLYYQNSHVTTAMQRNYKAGSGSNSAGCADSQYGGCFSGVWAAWADLPFMFGKMDGKVSPYPG
jgi:hypothetical protein